MAAHIDISYIVKRLKDFKRGIIDLDNLADGIFIDMDIKKDSLKKSQVKDHLEGLETSFALGNIKDSDIPALAREIYYMNFLPKNESKMKLSLKERKLVREYAKKLIEKRLNESTKLTGIQSAKTDGINSKDVKVKILEFVKHANYGEGVGDWNVYWVEYPKGKLNIAWTQSEGDESEKNILFTNPDAFWTDVLEMPENKVDKMAKEIAKKYNLTYNRQL